MNVTGTATEVLDLISQIGIRVTRVQDGIDDEFADLASCRKLDIVGQHERHADALVLWFEGEDDLMALQELTYNADEEEFGCDWPSVFPEGLRGMVASGPYARAILREDIPALVDLLRRELAGEFTLSPAARKALRLRRAMQVTSAAGALGAALQIVTHTARIEWVSWLLGGISVVLWVYWKCAIDEMIPPRKYLNRIRARVAVISAHGHIEVAS